MDDKKELIRKAAVRTIAAHGFHEATTRMIAQAAGTSIGTIYNYFESKEEVLAYIVDVERTRRVEFLRGVAQAVGAPEDKLRRFLDMHFRQVAEDPDTVRMVMREFHFSDREELEPLRTYFREIPLLLGDIVGEGLDAETARLRGVVVFGAVQSFTLEMLMSSDDRGLPPERAIETLVDLFFPRRDAV